MNLKKSFRKLKNKDKSNKGDKVEKLELLKQQGEMKIIQKRADMLRNTNLFVTDIKDDFLTESFFERKDISKYKKDSKNWIFLEICELDYTNGFSKLVPVETLDEYGLKTTNGGDWCRDDGTLGKYFNIDRVKDKGRIVGVQLLGYKKNSFSNKIKNDIRDFYSKLYCRVLAIGGSFIEIDHKDGRKDEFEMPENQSLDDFQPLHRNVNLAKREHCKKCKETNVRFNAKLLGYSVSQWIGTENYKGSCVGCFWYDPAEFNAKVSANYNKDR